MSEESKIELHGTCLSFVDGPYVTWKGRTFDLNRDEDRQVFFTRLVGWSIDYGRTIQRDEILNALGLTHWAREVRLK